MRAIQIALVVIWLIVSDSVLADEPLYTLRSDDNDPSSLVVTEFKREPLKSYISAPGYSKISDSFGGAYLWMLCALTDLADKRGFSYWLAIYPEGKVDTFVVGFLRNKTDDVARILGNDYDAARTITAKPVSVEESKESCGPRRYVAASPRSAFAQTELVLREGTRLEVTSPNGRLAIVAGPGIARQYQWDGCALDADMRPSKSRKKNGELSIYDNAYRNDWTQGFPSCKGVSRTIVSEAQRHFADLDSLLEWLHYSTSTETVWTNDGLFLRWNISPENQSKANSDGYLLADLILLCIDGRRPTKLPGASDQAIKLTHPAGAKEAVHACVRVGRNVIEETWRNQVEYWKENPSFGYVERRKRK